MKRFLVVSIDSLIVIAVIAGGLFLVNKNIPASGYLKIAAELGKDTPQISALGPGPRVRITETFQEILDSPVYFDVRALSWFDGAWVEVVYQPDGRTLAGMGVKVGEPWNFEMKKPISDVQLSDGWRQALFYFDLQSVLSIKNVKRFVIDSTGEPGAALRIKSLTLILER